MAVFDVDVQGVTYEVTAPDENTAWKWANAEHRKQTVKQVGPPGTTLEGLTGAAIRGAGPVAAGAALGAMAGAPLAGVGAIPGALAGAGAAGLATMAGDPIVRSINSMMGTDYKMPSQALEDLFTRIGVAQPRSEAERVLQATAAGAAGAGGVSALGKTLQTAGGPIAQAVGAQLAAQPLTQVAGGAGAGLAGQVAQEAGVGPLGQAAAALGGGVLGAGAAGLRATPNRPPSGSILEAEKRGIPVMTTDVYPPKTFIGKAAQAIGERIPVAGTSGIRADQQTQRVKAVRDLLNDFGASATANASDDVMRDLAQKRAGDLSKYSTMKNDVIESLDSAGTVDVSRTISDIDSQIAKLASLKTQEVSPAISVLEDWKNSLQGQSLKNIEALRKQLGESFKSPELTSVRSVSEKALSSIYGNLRNDMGDFIKANGQRKDYTKWAVGNKRLSQMAGELDMSALKNTLKRGDATPEVIDSMLFSQRPSELRALYSSLTPAGRANARTAILSRAAKKSTVEGEQGVTTFSPDRMATQLKSLDPSVKVFFSGDDLKQVEGLSRALALTQRASAAPVMTSTGQQAVPFVAGSFLADAFGSLGASLAAGATAGALARIYESAPVRNLLTKIPQTIAGSPEEAALVKRLASVLQNSTQTEGK